MTKEELEQAMTRASIEIFKCKLKPTGGTAAELEYGKAYSRLEKEGLRMKLKAKYKRGIK